MRTIVWRTALITDAEAMAAVDTALAERITGWGALSVAKTEAAIDALVDEVRPGRAAPRAGVGVQRDVQFGSPTDVAGTTSMWARLYTADAALIEARVEEMARSVCDDDPRTLPERRADALIALADRTDLACACGSPTAPAPISRAGQDGRGLCVADERSVDAAAADHGPPPPTTAAPTDHARRPRRADRQPTTSGGRFRRRAHRLPRPRRIRSALAARTAQCPRRRPTCSAVGSCPPRCWARSWSARGSARCATPAATRHPNRATPRRGRPVSSSGAGI